MSPITVGTSNSPAGLSNTADESTVIFFTLTDDGTTSGATNMNVDGSVTPVDYFYKPPAGKVLIAGRLNLYMEDGTNFTSLGFGGLSALTNGISVMLNNAEIKNFKTNIDLMLASFDTESRRVYGNELRNLAMRWTFSKVRDGLKGLVIKETHGFNIKIQDDLTGLVVLNMELQGTLQDA